MKKYFILFVLMAITLDCFSQEPSVIQLVSKYYKAKVELDRINPNETPDLCIEKSKQIIEIYNQIAKIDSTRINPQELFVPYSFIAHLYYNKKDVKNAIPYLEEAWRISQAYSSYLTQAGFSYDALMSLSTMLRDAYSDTGRYEEAISLSKEILSSYKTYNPKHMAFQQMAESQIYKLMDNFRYVIENDKKALDLFEKNGNDVQGFYSETIVNDILEGYLYCEDYKGALDFIDGNRDRLNQLFQGKDDLEFEKLNQTNKYLYQVYQHIGLYQRAANAAFLVSNYIKITEGDNCAKYASWMNNAAISYMDLYELVYDNEYLTKADSLFHVAEEIWKSVNYKDEQDDYATYLSNYGDLLSLKHEYAKAEELQKKALFLHKTMNASESVILFDMSRLAHTYGDAGKTQESLSLFEDLLERYERRCDTLQIARTCNLISQTYWIDLNDNERAEYYANKAYEILHQAGVTSELTSTITENLARVCYRLGLEDRALHYSIECLEIKKKLGVEISPYESLNAQEFYLDNFSALLYFYPKEQEKVLEDVESLCNWILDEYKGNTRNDYVLQWKSKNVLAKAYMFFHRFDDAESQYNDLLRIEEYLWGKNSGNYITTLNNLAYNYNLMGDYQKCRNVSLICAELDPTHRNYENILSCSIALDDIKMVEKYLPLTFNSSLDYLKSQFLFLSAEQREDMIERGRSVGFSNLPLSACAYPDNAVCSEYAYNSALVSKGLLLSTQNDIETAIMSNGNSEINKKYQELKQMQKKLQTATDSVNVVSLKRSIELKEKEILSSLRSMDDFTKNLDITYRNVQDNLNKNDIAIEFLELNKSILSPKDTTIFYAAVAIKKDWATPKFILLSEKTKVDKVVRNLVAKVTDAGYKEEKWVEVNKQLYNYIWKPISSFIEPNSNIYFSPIGLLSIAPLEVLKDSDGHYINEQNKVFRMTSTKYLCVSSLSSNKANAVLYGGLIYDTENGIEQDKSISQKKREGWQYLPSSAEEVANISSILQSNNVATQVYDKLLGTEESFKKQSGKSISILHLATHGFYLDEDESDSYGFFHDMNVKIKRGAGISTLLRSGLMLAGGQHTWLHGNKDLPQGKDDGILLASEISLLDLHSIDLVTLSACQTGLGDISDDGVMGLQRGFKRAGVNSLLMTLWPVDDDATQILMKQFYQNLMAGKSKRQSLVSAQKFLREYNDGYYSEPKYWAAYILLDGLDTIH
ncbi:MAG: CHAT domain-containing protein [Prevotella sp.]|nr:CHAT domain-containing protein [Prevotella sp.]